MPKERATRSISFEARSRASPYRCSSSSSHHKGSSSSSSRNPPESPKASAKDIKEWDETRCPVCMEHPHNAVLLLCTSGNKGCQPFMCDTSYRHSNCLDQYKKAFAGSLEENTSDQKPLAKLSCPLCRGGVTGWKVEEAARRHMNSKARSCSKESCGFTGSYGELRKHARTEHPSVRPSDADPERQRDWRRMEQQRDLGDLFSSMQPMLGGEEGGLGSLIDDDGELSMRSVAISPVAVLFIVRFSATAGFGSGRAFSRSLRGTPSRVASRSRRARAPILWGESLSEPDEPVPAEPVNGGGGAAGLDDNDDDIEVDDVDDVSGGSDEVAARPRRGSGRSRRRQLRMSDDEMDDDDLL